MTNDDSLNRLIARTNTTIRRRGSKSLKQPSDFVGPAESERIPFDEADLVPAQNVAQVSRATGYGDIISGAGEAAGQAIKGIAQNAQSKEELKLAKKRHMAEMLARAMKRDTGFYRLGADVGDENAENQASAIQDVAKGFAESYRR